MFAVWAITGLWHGADWTFILWGIYFGVILMAEKFFIGKYLEKLPGVRNIYSLFFIIIGWVIFRADSVAHAGEILRAMFGGYGAGGENMPLAMVLQQSEAGAIFFIALSAAVITSMPASRFIKEKLNRYKYGALAMDICILLAFIICAMELVIGSYNPFIYFDF
jgi:alginate O-acetyltransferase complex protein AlgI